MDPMLAALAAAAAGTFVKSMATDAWTAVSSGLARLFGGEDHDKVLSLTEAMDESKSRALAPDKDRATAIALEEARWSGRIESLLDDDATLTGPLRDALTSFDSMIARASSTAGETSMVISSGRDTYAAGRDQHIVRHENQRE